MGDGYTILIAEDDADIVSLLCLYLKNSGYRVITAGNGEDALSIGKGGSGPIGCHDAPDGWIRADQEDPDREQYPDSDPVGKGAGL